MMSGVLETQLNRQNISVSKKGTRESERDVRSFFLDHHAELCELLVVRRGLVKGRQEALGGLFGQPPTLLEELSTKNFLITLKLLLNRVRVGYFGKEFRY